MGDIILPPPQAPPLKQHPTIPAFWDLLNERDRVEYTRIRLTLSSSACKHRRHHSKEINMEIMNTIKQFVVRNEADDWRRALVCGICWINDGLAINTRQLRILLSKCKSSINAMFQNIGYAAVPSRSELTDLLTDYFPIIKDNFTEVRKWTIRYSKDAPQYNDKELKQTTTEVQSIEDLAKQAPENSS